MANDLAVWFIASLFLATCIGIFIWFAVDRGHASENGTRRGV